MDCTNCPYYEEHSGEYFQGCWEFTDSCWLAPVIDSYPHCHEDCFLINLNEKEMLSEFFKAYERTKEVWQFNKPPVQRPLTQREKSDILKELENCFEYINNCKRQKLIYK